MKRKPQGVALIYVIVLMSLLSVYLMELMSNSRTMLRQTRRAELVAINRNLQASAGAWARKHDIASMGQPAVTLDASQLSKYQPVIVVSQDKQTFQIKTSCKRATQTHKQTRKFKFSP
jgi:type II secretory pathway component PulK